MLRQPFIEPLQRHLARVKLQHEEDVRAGHGAVYLPYTLERKYPAAATDCADLATTMIYTHVLNKGGKGVKSPLEL